MSVERSRRWPPRQRIRLTPTGTAAVESYAALVAEARAKPQPASALEEELVKWSGTLGIRSADGVLLEELRTQSLTVNELARAVEACGQRPPEVKAGVDRLYGAGLVEPPPAEVPVPSPPPFKHGW